LCAVACVWRCGVVCWESGGDGCEGGEEDGWEVHVCEVRSCFALEDS
jgi:hypothetical protein